MFAVFAPFAVRNTADTPFEFYEPRTTRRARTRASSLPSRLSVHTLEERGNSPWTLPRTASDLLGSLPFLFAVFAPFAVRIIADSPFEFHEPRTTRTVRTRASSSFTALVPSLEGWWKLSLVPPFFVRGFRAFRGEIFNEHSGLES